MPTPWKRRLRALGPAMPAPARRESLRAAAGAMAGLLVGAAVMPPGASLALALALIAPFGATAVLVFAVPNSPLAQPWSAVVGNAVSALVAVAVVRLVPDPLVAVALATGGAIIAMGAARALHPPGGAVALTAALNPDAIHEAGFRFALAPVALGTLALVLLGIGYARATGRRYPFRQTDAPNVHGTGDRPAMQRLGLSEDELRALLTEFRQATNLGPEDLARLIAGAELRAASHHLGGLTCGDIMSRDLVTVAPDTPREAVAAIFAEHTFTSLPVVTAGGDYRGVIFQIRLIQAGDGPATASDLMLHDLPSVGVGTPVAALLPLLAEGEVDAVPVLRGDEIVGIVTRTDLIAALASRLATTPPTSLPRPGVGL